MEHGCRVTVPWPERLPYPVIELCWEDEAGRPHSRFDRRAALAAMMISRAVELNPPEQVGAGPAVTIDVDVDVSDVFAWGCWDVQTIALGQVEEVFGFWSRDRVWGPSVWAMILRREMPQGPVEHRIRQGGVWDLDALRAAHGLRANRYDGLSQVLAAHKNDAYVAWRRRDGMEPVPIDARWWTGWEAYARAYRGWEDEAWKAEDERLCAVWRDRNGYPACDRLDRIGRIERLTRIIFSQPAPAAAAPRSSRRQRWRA